MAEFDPLREVVLNYIRPSAQADEEDTLGLNYSLDNPQILAVTPVPDTSEKIDGLAQNVGPSLIGGIQAEGGQRIVFRRDSGFTVLEMQRKGRVLEPVTITPKREDGEYLIDNSQLYFSQSGKLPLVSDTLTEARDWLEKQFPTEV